MTNILMTAIRIGNPKQKSYAIRDLANKVSAINYYYFDRDSNLLQIKSGHNAAIVTVEHT